MKSVIYKTEENFVKEYLSKLMKTPFQYHQVYATLYIDTSEVKRLLQQKLSVETGVDATDNFLKMKCIIAIPSSEDAIRTYETLAVKILFQNND